MTAVVCAFFTVFTGGSGVTILALGGLLIEALRADGYRENFSLGLMTASGSLGLLFPPALPLILFGIVAMVPIADLFIGGLLPGILLLTLIALLGVREGKRTAVSRQSFNWQETWSAAWEAKWELMLPILVLVAIFGGFATKSLAYYALIDMLILSEMLMQTSVAQIFGENEDLVEKHDSLRKIASATIKKMQDEIGGQSSATT